MHEHKKAMTAIDNDMIQLTEEQVLMLYLSDADIAHGRLITQDEIDEADLAWLNEAFI